MTHHVGENPSSGGPAETIQHTNAACCRSNRACGRAHVCRLASLRTLHPRDDGGDHSRVPGHGRSPEVRRETMQRRALRPLHGAPHSSRPGVCFMLVHTCMTGALVRLLRAGRRLAVVLAILCAGPAFALHRESPPPVRLSSGGPHFVPAPRPGGVKAALSATDDLVNKGSTPRKNYLFN